MVQGSFSLKSAEEPWLNSRLPPLAYSLKPACSDHPRIPLWYISGSSFPREEMNSVRTHSAVSWVSRSTATGAGETDPDQAVRDSIKLVFRQISKFPAYKRYRTVSPLCAVPRRYRAVFFFRPAAVADWNPLRVSCLREREKRIPRRKEAYI